MQTFENDSDPEAKSVEEKTGQAGYCRAVRDRLKAAVRL
jgi:hypothetical protein